MTHSYQKSKLSNLQKSTNNFLKSMKTKISPKIY